MRTDMRGNPVFIARNVRRGRLDVLKQMVLGSEQSLCFFDTGLGVGLSKRKYPPQAPVMIRDSHETGANLGPQKVGAYRYQCPIH